MWGSTILPTLFKDALKASAILGLKMESRSSEEGKRLTIGGVDGVPGFRRLIADSPSGGREFSNSIDGKVGQTRKHRAQIVANW